VGGPAFALSFAPVGVPPVRAPGDRPPQSRQLPINFELATRHLRPTTPRCEKSRCKNAAVERLTRNDRASAVAAAAAHDLNDEMTIILNSASVALELLEPGHPARLLLHDLSAAGQRCVWKTSAVLNFTARQGVYPVNASLEHLAMGE